MVYHNKALVIVDAQRGFMPAEEGQRLGVEGFGELTVPDGHQIVTPTNRMSAFLMDHEMPIATTQDYHPEETAHFADPPSFVDTWPVHCVGGTAGAELHPELIAATHPHIAHFIKGDVAARTPAEDNSYSGALAHRIDPETKAQEFLPDYLKKLNVLTAYVCGLTVGKEQPLCVDSTAIDLQKRGFDVAVVTDAVEAVVPEDFETCMQNLGALGIRLVDSHQVIAEVAATPEMIER